MRENDNDGEYALDTGFLPFTGEMSAGQRGLKSETAAIMMTSVRVSVVC